MKQFSLFLLMSFIALNINAQIISNQKLLNSKNPFPKNWNIPTHINNKPSRAIEKRIRAITSRGLNFDYNINAYNTVVDSDTYSYIGLHTSHWLNWDNINAFRENPDGYMDLSEWKSYVAYDSIGSIPLANKYVFLLINIFDSVYKNSLTNKYILNWDSIAQVFDTTSYYYYINDSIGQKTKLIDIEPNKYTNNLDTTQIFYYTYNSNHLLTSEHNYYYSTNLGYPYYFKEYKYDTLNNQILFVNNSNYDLSNNIFNNTEIDSTVYNGQSFTNYHLFKNNATYSTAWANDLKTDFIIQNNRVNYINNYYKDTTLNIWKLYENDSINYYPSKRVARLWAYDSANIKTKDFNWTRNIDNEPTKIEYFYPKDSLYQTYTYNYLTGNLVSKMQLVSYDKGSLPILQGVQGTEYFYYEDFNAPTSINQSSISINNTILYPNPATINTYVSFNSKTTSAYKIKVIDIFGKEIFTTIDNQYIGDHLIKIPLNNFTNGIYFVCIENNNSILKTLKLQVQN